MKKLISDTEYHAHPAVGSTLMKSIALKSILHALKSERSESDSMVLGSALHCKLLQPEDFHAKYIECIECDRRTKDGKEAWAYFLKESEGRTVLTKDQHLDIINMAKAVNEHEIASAMLSGGESEYSYFVTDADTGLEVKCRPDLFNKNALIDLKSCQDASNEAFTRACINLGYHIQAAFYLDVFNAATSSKIEEFYFIAVENKAPYAVNIFKMGDVEIGLGREQYKKALKQYSDYIKMGETKVRSFGYPLKINEIQFPIWALQKLEGATV